MNLDEMRAALIGRRIIDVEHDERYTGRIDIALESDSGERTMISIGTMAGDPYIYDPTKRDA